MKLHQWKLATINVKGINDQSKFDDVIHWIQTNDFDITILTETKLDPIKAFHNFDNKNKIQKNYKNSWTIDHDHPKGSGVSIITKKETVGKHHYKTTILEGRIIQMHFRFKGKITVT